MEYRTALSCDEDNHLEIMKRISYNKRMPQHHFRPLLFLGGIALGISLIGFAWLFQFRQPTAMVALGKIPQEFIEQEHFSRALDTFRVPILMYHYVEHVTDTRDTIRQSLAISPTMFESQMKTLKEAGYTFLTASELADIMDGKRRLPNKPVLITIDDGHWDIYTDILPILQKYNVKATAYIISGFIDRLDFMTTEQLQKVIASDLVEIGDHTAHHTSLAYQSAQVVTYEVMQSKIDLESRFHINVDSFAYPEGSFDTQAANIVKLAGYRLALSTMPGVEQSQKNRFFLYRIRPGYRTGTTLLSYLQQTTAYAPY